VKSPVLSIHTAKARETASAFFNAALFVAMLALPSLAFAADDAAEATTKVSDFFVHLKGLLSVASLAVVTIAVVFAGYQIAFAHKRIADVAPILIGGFLIGAAGQVASMLVGDGKLS